MATVVAEEGVEVFEGAEEAVDSVAEEVAEGEASAEGEEGEAEGAEVGSAEVLASQAWTAGAAWVLVV